MTPQRLDQLVVRHRDQWHSWLAAHHQQSRGVWVRPLQRLEGHHVKYTEVAEDAVAFGWMGTVRRRLPDGGRPLFLVVPRPPQTCWTGLDKRRAQFLIDNGTIHPAGLEKVRAAQQDGSWSALDVVEELLSRQESMSS